MTTLDGGARPTRVPEWLRQRAALTPDRIALIGGDEAPTFAALDAQADAAAGRLASAGVGRGDRVALLAANSLDFVRAVHAVGRRGAVLLPLNVRLTPAELAWQLADAGARLLVFDAANADAARALAATDHGLRLLPLAELTARDGAAAGSEGDREGMIDLAAVHSIIYTSGTTGRPKGVLLTYGNYLWSAVGSALNLGLAADDRWLACLPLFHVGGLSILLRGVIYGATVEVHAAFDAAAANRAIDGGVTLLSVVSTMLERMLEERAERDYPASLRCVLVGGGPVPPHLLGRATARAMPVAQTYGLTEAASQVATLAPAEAASRIGAAGKPLLPTELRVVDGEGRACPAGAPGEIVVRGPTVTPGYLNAPEETARALREGWLHTGDIGYLDAAGYLYVLDRRDDLIVSGGENVYPAEVEAALEAHPAVREAAVFGRADRRWGQAVSAVVVLREGGAVTAAALSAFCRERLAAFKVPTRFEFDGPLPRTAAGKLARHQVRERWAAGSALTPPRTRVRAGRGPPLARPAPRRPRLPPPP